MSLRAVITAPEVCIGDSHEEAVEHGSMIIALYLVNGRNCFSLASMCFGSPEAVHFHSALRKTQPVLMRLCSFGTSADRQ